MDNSTLGLIETYGYLSAIEGLDVALKTSNVELISREFVGGGIVTILITGDVASVKAAVDASSKAIERVGVLRSVHVIPRADKEIWKIINKENTCEIRNEEGAGESVTEENNDFQSSKDTIQNSAEAAEHNSTEKNEHGNEPDITDEYAERKKELENLTVTELRAIARKTDKIKLTKEEIKFSKKDKLIEEILKIDIKKEE